MKPTWDIVIRDLDLTIGGNILLDHISCDFLAGHVTAVIGPNGSGKTTLLRAILAQLPYRGTIEFRATPTQTAAPIVGYVPQHFEFDRGTPITVEDFLLTELQRRPLWLGAKAAARALAVAELKQVGAGQLSGKRLGALSGGELQRVVLAKALLRNPDILLLDEPVSGVDIAGEALFCDLLESLQEQRNFTLVMVSHDLSVVSRHADRVVCINRHLVCQGSVTEVITADTIQKIYGAHMGFHRHGGKHGME